jgi:hypothetical protein
MLLQSLHKSAWVMVILIIILLSCKKQSTPTETNSKGNEIIHINRLYHTHAPLISDSEFVIVQVLFQKNNLSLSNLQVYKLLTNNSYHFVRCYQFIYGLELFTNDVVFVFDGHDNYNSLGGELITSIALDTIPMVTTNDAGTLFFNEIKSDPWYKDSLESFLNYGFNAELGIYDMNTGTSYAPLHFVLVWKLTVTNGMEYPVGFIRADSLHLIYYFNGIIIG